MNLSVGDVAPAFELYSDNKEVVRLSDLIGDRNLLLLFFPCAFSGHCTTELNTVNNDLDYFTERNTKVVGVSTDALFSLAEFAKANHLNFQLLSDHNVEASTAYGVKYAKGKFPFEMERVARRSAFVIDTEGKVRYAEVLESAGNQPDLDKIKEVVDSL